MGRRKGEEERREIVEGKKVGGFMRKDGKEGRKVIMESDHRK